MNKQVGSVVLIIGLFAVSLGFLTTQNKASQSSPHLPKPAKLLDALAQNNTLYLNQTLLPNQTLVSADTHTTLAMQTDGNLVIYKNKKPLWALSFFTKNYVKNSYLTLTQTGVLQVVSPTNEVLWQSTSKGYGATLAQIENDGNIILSSSTTNPSSTVLWGTGIGDSQFLQKDVTSSWSGYAQHATNQTTFSSVVMTETVPTFTCKNTQTYTYIWAGIDGALYSPTVQQTGVDLYCGLNNTNTYVPYVFAWYELYPAQPVVIQPNYFPVAMGDSVTDKVVESASAVTFTLRNESTGFEWSKTLPVANTKRATAECIVEEPGSPPAPTSFSSTNITNCQTQQTNNKPSPIGQNQNLTYFNACSALTNSLPTTLWTPADFTVRNVSTCSQTRPNATKSNERNLPIPQTPPISLTKAQLQSF